MTTAEVIAVIQPGWAAGGLGGGEGAVLPGGQQRTQRCRRNSLKLQAEHFISPLVSHRRCLVPDSEQFSLLVQAKLAGAEGRAFNSSVLLARPRGIFSLGNQQRAAHLAVTGSQNGRGGEFRSVHLAARRLGVGGAAGGEGGGGLFFLLARSEHSGARGTCWS